MRGLIRLAAAVAVLAPSPAYAGHAAGAPAPQRSFASAAEPATSMSLELSSSSFDLDGTSGTFWTATARGDYWRGPLGVHLRAPVHTLSMDDRTRATGIGDVMAGATWVVPAGDSYAIGLGADLYLPTGDSDSGLGAGTFAVGPNVRATAGLSPALQLHGTAGALINTSAGETTLFVDQRADAELRFGAALAWQTGRLRLAAQSRAGVPLAPVETRGSLYLAAGPSAAIDLGHHAWLDAFAELPLRSERQFDWRIGLAFGYRLNHGHTH
jgi:hypothetical protein